MSTLIEIIQGLGGIFLSLVNVYVWVIIIAALLSFVNPDPYNPVVQFLHRITQPAYNFVRRFMRTDFNGLDLAPLIIIIALQIVVVVVGSILSSL
ncbi:YggT family protein [Epsilonproteobacteria bacterium SCGC AD-311-C15]|jgi:YggT family protein|nr:YggT family protein [Epsilonproteobacteria bacterium SCGC AD-311-C15]